MSVLPRAWYFRKLCGLCENQRKLVTGGCYNSKLCIFILQYESRKCLNPSDITSDKILIRRYSIFNISIRQTLLISIREKIFCNSINKIKNRYLQTYCRQKVWWFKRAVNSKHLFYICRGTSSYFTSAEGGHITCLLLYWICVHVTSWTKYRFKDKITKFWHKVAGTSHTFRSEFTVAVASNRLGARISS